MPCGHLIQDTYRAELGRQKDLEAVREDSQKGNEKIETQKRMKLDAEALTKDINMLKQKL